METVHHEKGQAEGNSSQKGVQSRDSLHLSQRKKHVEQIILESRVQLTEWFAVKINMTNVDFFS